MTTNAVPPPPFGDNTTRSLVIALRADHERSAKDAAEARGRAAVWRWLGALAAGVAITLAGWALVFARDAAVDHEIVARHDRELDEVHVDLVAIRTAIAANTAILERVERRLDREEP